MGLVFSTDRMGPSGHSTTYEPKNKPNKRFAHVLSERAERERGEINPQTSTPTRRRPPSPSEPSCSTQRPPWPPPPSPPAEARAAGRTVPPPAPPRAPRRTLRRRGWPGSRSPPPRAASATAAARPSRRPGALECAGSASGPTCSASSSSPSPATPWCAPPTPSSSPSPAAPPPGPRFSRIPHLRRCYVFSLPGSLGEFVKKKFNTHGQNI